MNNRQELWAAIERRVPARIPYTYEAHPETTDRLRRHLGLREDADPAGEFGCNWFSVVWEATGYKRPSLPEREARNAAAFPGLQVDAWGRRTRSVRAGGMTQTETVFCPLSGAESVGDIEGYD